MNDTYTRDGFRVVRQAIPPADLEPFRACIERQVDVYARDLFDRGKVDDVRAELPFGQRLAALHGQNEIRLRNWDAPVFGPELHALIHHPGIVDALDPHLGPDFSFNGDYHLRPKMPDSELTAFPSTRTANTTANLPGTPTSSPSGSPSSTSMRSTAAST